MKTSARIPLLVFCIVCLLSGSVSCSTTRCLEPGQIRLVKNRIEIENAEELESSKLAPFIKQKTGQWSPAIYVYHWQNGKGKGWDKFVKKIGTVPVVYDSVQTVNSCINIQDRLDYLGYYDSKVTFSQKFSAGNKKVSVTYHVKAGKKYPVCSIEYQIPESDGFREDFMADSSAIMVHTGDFLSEDLLEKESVRSSAVLRTKGYYSVKKNSFTFEADTVSVRDSAKLTYIAKENMDYGKYHLGKVEVVYPADLKFREKVFRDLNILKTGELYNEERVNTVYGRYNAINMFSSVNVQLTPRDSARIVDCSIYPQKSRIQGFKVGLEMSFNTAGLFGVSPEVSYFHRNIFHGGEVLNVSFSTDHQFKFNDTSVKANEISTSVSLLIPRFLPFSPKLVRGTAIPKTEVRIMYNFQNRPEYQRHIISATYGYLGRLDKINMHYQFNPISVNMVWLPFMSDSFRKSIEHDKFMRNTYSNHSDLGMNGNIVFSNFNYQTGSKTGHGWYSGMKFDMSGNIMCLFNGVMKKNEQGQSLVFNSAYAQYVRFDFNFGRTWNWRYEHFYHSLALHAECGIGYAYGNSISLPFEKQFFSGGANSLRGWTARSVGPGTSSLDTFWTIPNQTGDMKLEANIEYRFKIFWKLEGAVFLDAGNIWNLPKKGEGTDDPSVISGKNFGQAIAADWGYGLRVDLNFLILRFDLGMRIHDPARTDSKWVPASMWYKNGNFAFQFGVGYPF